MNLCVVFFVWSLTLGGVLAESSANPDLAKQVPPPKPERKRPVAPAAPAKKTTPAPPAAIPANVHPGASSGYLQVTGATVHAMSLGTLYLPTPCQPRDGKLALWVHFHGSEPTVVSNFLASGKSAAVAVINYKGLSGSYSRPFADAQLFGKVIEEATQKLSTLCRTNLALDKLAVSSFSAGYGAVREILKKPDYVKQVTDLLLADSLYASISTNQDGKRLVLETDIAPFLAFAKLAAQGEKTFVITHSEFLPPTYAGTPETADSLIAAAGATRQPASDKDSTGMTRASTVDLGGFHVRGYQGKEGEDHMAHLRRLCEAMRLTSLPDKP